MRVFPKPAPHPFHCTCGRARNPGFAEHHLWPRSAHREFQFHRSGI